MSLPLPHYLKTSPSLPHSLNFSHSEIQQMGLECNNMFAFCFSGGGQSNGWVGRCRCSFLKNKKTKTKKTTQTKRGWGRGCGTLFKQSSAMIHCVCALWAHTQTIIWPRASLPRHHIEAQQECVTDPHSEREG